MHAGCGFDLDGDSVLSREFPGSSGFTDEEICHRVNKLTPGGRFSISAIRRHIALHSVASKKPDPRNQRKLYANEDGTYRLYWSKDLHRAAGRNDKIVPAPASIEAKFLDLLQWYRREDALRLRSPGEEDPILALRGLGKELWRELEGGEKFIREIRANWYGPAAG